MKITQYRDVEEQAVTMPGSSGCTVRWLVGEREGAPNFAMRQFEVAPGGYTPLHHHPYEHEVFVLEGTGTIREGEREHKLRPGDVVFVVPDEVHQFRNTGEVPLKFLCLVPNSAQGPQMAVTPECGVEKK